MILIPQNTKCTTFKEIEGLSVGVFCWEDVQQVDRQISGIIPVVICKLTMVAFPSHSSGVNPVSFPCISNEHQNQLNHVQVTFPEDLEWMNEQLY